MCIELVLLNTHYLQCIFYRVSLIEAKTVRLELFSSFFNVCKKKKTSISDRFVLHPIQVFTSLCVDGEKKSSRRDVSSVSSESLCLRVELGQERSQAARA